MQRVGTKDSPILLVVPPFCDIFMPSLAIHIVRDVLQRSGVVAEIYYANLVAAKAIGFDVYHALAESNRGLVCERLMSVALSLRAHPNVPVESDGAKHRLSKDIEVILQEKRFGNEVYWSVESLLAGITAAEDAFREVIGRKQPDLIAFTSTFQTIGAIELFAGAARASAVRKPHIVVGGSNAEGEMSEGLTTFFTAVDHIFSGEVGSDFVEYCKTPGLWRSGVTSNRALRPPYPEKLDFTEFYEQCREVHHPRISEIWLPFETSRGCWFGEHSHCTFCGLNGAGIAYRSKTSDAAIDEYRYYRDTYRPDGFFMVDNIIPRDFFEKFLRPIAEERDKPQIFYEVKSNLTRDEIVVMKSAGARSFQPGIEAISTPLLKHMKKGVSAFINLRTLFWAKQIGINVTWNLLSRFPGDRAEWYRQTATLLPYIRHLHPPQQVMSNVSIDRFSPLFNYADRYGIKNMRPVRLYDDIFAGGTVGPKIAYHFEADFESEFSDDIRQDLDDNIRAWRREWAVRVPSVEAFAISDGHLLIVDTRDNVNSQRVLVDRDASLLSFLSAGATGIAEEKLRWLIERGFVLRLENRHVNLVERLHREGEVIPLPFLPGEFTSAGATVGGEWQVSADQKPSASN